MADVMLNARQCNAESIPLELANDFLEINHDQKSLKTAFSVTSIGLYHEEELVGVVQFSYPRTPAKQAEFSAELLRLCFKKEVRVRGGASKLIAYYRAQFKPSDFFTYQDTTGEVTDVYKHAGMTLLSQTKKKQYLVAPGKTTETGNRKEVLGMAYAVRYGPDRILGTKLGEVMDPETGKRKSNKRIFLEELGWHLEETSGDRVWAWFNPEVTFYTYKITATDSDKYYFGVSHVKKANATERDCLGDGYYGSGGTKFQNWVKNHANYLRKEIFGVYSKKVEAYLEEKELVGSLHKDDPKCLNSTTGGKGTRTQKFSVAIHFCPTCQTDTKHFGNSCRKCSTQKSFTVARCDVCDKDTPHRVGRCVTCKNKGQIQEKFCSLCQKETKHNGKSCYKCRSRKTFSDKFCEICGEVTSHAKDSCRKCSTRSAINVRFCEECQKETKHNGTKCSSCQAHKTISIKYCLKCDAETKHQGNKCYTCLNRSSLDKKYCEECQEETKHNGKSCYKCRSSRSRTSKFCKACEKNTPHNGSSCERCLAKNRSYTQIFCEVCEAITIHHQSSCCSCRSTKAYSTRKASSELIVSP